jgi:hypothetical protein
MLVLLVNDCQDMSLFILAYLNMFYLFLIFHLVNNLFYFILFQQWDFS